ncbi:hypothetical protein V5S96_01275 [Corynebacterium mastitidis]|uniref:Uncharacterized protein n=1 Tax=Corynebacterium mastitidis TaxID=161890 RepID=A0ABU8NVH1_9CORY
MQRGLRIALVAALACCALCAVLWVGLVARYEYHNRPLDSFREELHAQGRARVSDHFDAEEFVFDCPYVEASHIHKRYGWDVNYMAAQYEGGPTELIMRKGDSFGTYAIARQELNLCEGVEGKIYSADAVVIKEGEITARRWRVRGVVS